VTLNKLAIYLHYVTIHECMPACSYSSCLLVLPTRPLYLHFRFRLSPFILFPTLFTSHSTLQNAKCQSVRMLINLYIRVHRCRTLCKVMDVINLHPLTLAGVFGLRSTPPIGHFKGMSCLVFPTASSWLHACLVILPRLLRDPAPVGRRPVLLLRPRHEQR
jgi:hypothetical protein